jgi:hypothetical protein
MIALMLTGVAVSALFGWCFGRLYEKNLWLYHYRITLEDGRAIQWNFKKKKFVDL